MICHSCLKIIRNGDFCQKCKKELFDGVSVSKKLPLSKPEFNLIRKEMSGRFSISGVQNKISLSLEGKKFVSMNNNGTYILKPSAERSGLRFEDSMSANEHITMQIARQIFGISTARCALLNFPDGEYAYVTRRFDRKSGHKLRQEDFCQLSDRSEDTHGKNYKYDCSYELVGKILKQYCPAYKIESLKLFSLILFSYLIGNGDLHLKNFSLIESDFKDFILTPAYDLMNTTLHIPNENRTALNIFENYETEHFKTNGFYGREDFLHLSSLYEISLEIAKKIISDLILKESDIYKLINISFLTEDSKLQYCNIVKDRIKALTV